jgi:hypothetical protein
MGAALVSFGARVMVGTYKIADKKMLKYNLNMSGQVGSLFRIAACVRVHALSEQALVVAWTVSQF